MSTDNLIALAALAVSICMPLGILFLGTMLAVIGFLFKKHADRVEKNLDELPVIREHVAGVKTELAVVQTKVAHSDKRNDERHEDFCERLGGVEQAVRQFSRA
jgi:predicted tellurium resistance membrane protein TerC